MAPEIQHEDVIAVDRAYRMQEMGLKIDGTQFNLRDYPWCIEVLNDDHPHQVNRKGAQLGLTVAMILRTIDMSMYDYPRGVLYLMPTRDDVADFSKTRFSRFLEENKDTPIGMAVEGTDSMGVKKIGNAFVYFRGARARSGLKSIPVDAIYTDEEDEMDPGMVSLAEHRLDGSKFKHHCRLSTPSIPDYGVDYFFNRSDRRHWVVNCEACGGWTCLELEFPECLERKGDLVYRACKKCRREIFARRGQWVAEAPSVTEIRGRYISQLWSPTVSIGAMLDEFEGRTELGPLGGERKKEFYNSRLGLPYADIEDLLDEPTLRNICDDYPMQSSDEGPCAIGADIGKKEHHYHIVKRTSETSLQVVKRGSGDFAHLADQMRRFNVQVGVFDMMAEQHAVRAFQDAHPEVYGCIYSEAQKGSYDWQEGNRQVKVNRNEILDESHRMILRRQVVTPRPGDDWKPYVAQMTNLARTVVRDEKTGTPKVVWIFRGRKNDHWRHAWGYAVLAAKQLSIARNVRRARGSSYSRPPGTTWMSM